MNQDHEAFDRRVRVFIYETSLSRGYPPLLQEVAQEMGAPAEAVHAAFQRLAAGRMLVLQGESGEILMANPFSAVPTPFLVETEAYTCFANCIWDALGVPAMSKGAARIKTACSDCGEALLLQVEAGAVSGDPSILHFAVPAARWWEDIVFS